MNRLKHNEKGAVAAIFLILGALILIMLVLIFAPDFSGAGEDFKQQEDRAHVQTAEDSARLKFSATGAFTAIYDYTNKRFVTGVNGRNLEPYGKSKENIGKVIYVEVNSSGKIKTYWDVPRELPKTPNGLIN